MNITPIFIMGSPRNGTTWLSNTVGDYQCVSSIRHFLHWGNHESNLYKKTLHYGDLSKSENYIPFVAQFSICDLFVLAGGDQEKLKNTPYKDFYSVFFDLMDDLTLREGNRFWMTKLDPQFFRDPLEFNRFMSALNKRYAKPKFLFIERDLKGVINSFINFISFEKKLSHLRLLYIACKMMVKKIAYDHFFKSVIRQTGGLSFRYEDLLRDNQNQLNRLETFIGIEDSSRKPGDYLKNSSFHNKKPFRLHGVEMMMLTRIIHPVLAVLRPLTQRLARMTFKKRLGRVAYYRLIQYAHYRDAWYEEAKRLNLSRITYLIDEYDKREHTPS